MKDTDIQWHPGFIGAMNLELKKNRDELDIDVFYKASAYASLYKSYGKTLDSIKADDVTVSLVREAKPYGLLRYFKEHDYLVFCPYRGIYYVEGKVLFPTQIVVTKEMNRAEHIWLSSLSDKLEKQNLLELFRRNRKIAGKRRAGICKICFGSGT